MPVQIWATYGVRGDANKGGRREELVIRGIRPEWRPHTAEEPGMSTPATAFHLEPGLISTEYAARFCGVSPAHWKRLLNQGRIGPRPVRLGDRVLWRPDELRRWIAAGLPQREEWAKQR